MIDLSNLDDVAKQVGGEVVGGCVIASVNGKKEYITQRNGSSVYATELGMQVFANMDRVERMREVVRAAPVLKPQAPAEDNLPPAEDNLPPAEDNQAALDLEAALAAGSAPGT